MPKASAPIAPWVEVWLSPQTIVMPGRLMPCSGPMIWTMPWRGSRIGKIGHAELGDVALPASRPGAGFPAPRCPRRRSLVGTLWSTTAIVASGAAHLAAGQRAGPRKPAGWSPHGRGGGRYRGGRCRPASRSTTWPSQILSNSVRGRVADITALLSQGSSVEPALTAPRTSSRHARVVRASTRGGGGLRCIADGGASARRCRCAAALPSARRPSGHARARRCGPTCRCGHAGNTASRGARRRGAPPRSRRCVGA